ncbi:PREDICTED: trihelix transcription factor ASR3 isoform X2 [Lupinus angustifolius]|uniref:trihelix transcription factor ASR3 isoform X2 n=1 Tax=Lupinus angustifolius TaxID=3871 RepID=UPI00092F524A|nr:PREDICTED: trihelix transcription factor ASR3 isoform X2 [Lupinus angustifolius]
MKENNNNNDVTRRTRFQAAPDWSVTESLILVNEVAAVEADCGRALSSYQQWNIIAGNCAALDVGRNLGQCRRKWDSLLSEYYKIRLWEESKHGRGGGGGGGRKNRLPENFDSELYKAIDELVKAREERGEVEIESDPESGNDALDVTVEIGSKRKRRQSKSDRHHGEKPRKSISEEQEYERGCVEQRHDENHEEEEEPEKYDLGEEYLKDFLEEKSKSKSRPERPPKSLAKEEPHENHSIEESKSSGEEKKTFISKEESEERMALKLQELAVKIQAIGTESLEYDATETQNNAEEYNAEFTRSQGDKLIENLGNFADTLKQLCGLLQECK